ncbi:biotin--protein ligase isoform X2 [Vespa velutina]|nr:biotin--protein ligase isoform X2 [Vespa velutina]
MLLTFLYMIATTIQTWRISSLKARLCAFFQGTKHDKPSIMLYAKPLACINEEYNNLSSPSGSENGETDNFMSSHLCQNKSLAKLGDLLWSHGDARLCTIYPQQKINMSEWLAYQKENPFIPIFKQNINVTSLIENYRMHILIEADFNMYQPYISTNSMKLEDYGLIISWMADKNLNIIMETDLDLVTKFAIAVMEGQYYINNGLTLTRILSVLVSGYPCTYHSEQLYSLPDNKLTGVEEWETYVKKLRLISNTARLASQQNKSMDVAEIPDLFIFPNDDSANVQISTDEKIETNNMIESPNNITTLQTTAESPVSINSEIIDTKSMQSENINNLEESDIPTFNDVPESNRVSSIKSNIIKTTLDKDKIKETCEDIAKSGSTTDDQDNSTKTTEAVSTPILKSLTPKRTVTPYSKNYKPPNVLIYAESAVSLDNVKTVLEASLGTDKYILYVLSREEACSDVWMEQAALVVVCGNVGVEISTQLIEYIVHGGKLLALCSDTLHTLLPSFKTAEVREHELVHFSYGKWKHVRMMHHIFCYQASPVRTRFSHENEDINLTAMSPPVSATVKDKTGKSHSFGIKVLGTEETWHTPSIILANLTDSNGKAVFSQIHLEADPAQYELEENKFNALKKSDLARLEIFNDLLSVHLGIEVNPLSKKTSVNYTPAFFLGRHELKLEVLEKLKEKMHNDTLKMQNLEIQFCKKNIDKSASSSFLPVMIHQCPDNFSTIEYFESLKTKDLGRLVIYADILTSSMNVVNGQKLQHGLVVIPYQQTQGRGRNKNVWLSPKGCAMFTIQLHIPKNSYLGVHISILQHLVIVGIVSAVTSVPGYEGLDLRVKWPNDIYVGKSTKIGGIIVTSHYDMSLIICNAGVGVNLSNSTPTCCINDVIAEYNKVKKTNLPLLSYERYFALAFSEIEYLLDIVQSGNIDYFFQIYYKFWLHTDTEVTIVSSNGDSELVKILGIDEYGFLKVRGNKGNTFSVQPDGNSYDLLKNLIKPI